MAQILTKKQVLKLIEEGIGREIEAVKDKIIQAAKGQVEQEIKGKLATLAASVLSYYDMSMDHGKVVITVKNELGEK